MFGIDMPVSGLLLFQSKNAEHLNGKELFNEVWTVVQEANSREEGLS
jgi:hypothetical protein